MFLTDLIVSDFFLGFGKLFVLSFCLIICVFPFFSNLFSKEFDCFFIKSLILPKFFISMLGKNDELIRCSFWLFKRLEQLYTLFSILNIVLSIFFIHPLITWSFIIRKSLPHHREFPDSTDMVFKIFLYFLVMEFKEQVVRTQWLFRGEHVFLLLSLILSLFKILSWRFIDLFL